MKIYTKGGDKGETSLVGGERIAKSDERIELYGEVDELNSFLGFFRTKTDRPILEKIQNILFDLGSLLACDHKDWNKYKLDQLDASFILEIESEIDKMEKDLGPLKNFILPGGSESSSLAHICRTVTRRVERKLVALFKRDSESVPERSIQFLNRLSDFFFVYARYLNYKEDVEEVLWKKN